MGRNAALSAMQYTQQTENYRSKQLNDKINMEKTFIRVRSIKDITIFVSLVLAGCILIALPTSTAVNITGFFLIFAGLILAFVLKSAYKDTVTGTLYQKKEHYFQQAMNASISAALESKPESIDLGEAEKGNAVKLDIYYSKASGKAYLQLFEYIPYKYEPCSKIYEHPLQKVEKLIK